jgi:hypothetical protein
LISTLEVIARFGVGKSDPHHKEDSYGYFFGNVTHHMDPNEKFKTKTSALVLVNRQLFQQIYGIHKTSAKVVNKVVKSGDNKDNKTVSVRSPKTFCDNIFDVVDTKAYDQTCYKDNKWDLIRFVPCLEGAVCDGAAKSSQIVQNYQFTYVIEDQTEPTYGSIDLFMLKIFVTIFCVFY